MSRELMAECLGEAADLWDAWFSTSDVQNGEVERPERDYTPIATLAVALYQERCRNPRRVASPPKRTWKLRNPLYIPTPKAQ